MAKKPTKKRGPRKRQRTSVLLRLDPVLVQWYEKAAAADGRSRNDLMECSLRLLSEVIEDVKREQEEFDPHDAVTILGHQFVAKLMTLGVADAWMRFGWEEYLREQARNVEAVRQDKLERGRE